MWLSDFKLQMLREHLGGEFYATAAAVPPTAVGVDEAESPALAEPSSASAEEPTADAAVASNDEEARSPTIKSVLAYRSTTGRDQWQVAWHGDHVHTWEYWGVLDTDGLRERAAALQASAQGRGPQAEVEADGTGTRQTSSTRLRRERSEQENPTRSGSPRMQMDGVLPEWTTPLLLVLGAATMAPVGVLSMSFEQVLKGRGAPFVPTARQKLQVLFGEGGCLRPGSSTCVLDAQALSAREIHLVDLGSGDGSIVRAATRMGGYGRATGYEINPALVRWSELQSAGAANEQYREESLWHAALDDADVVVVYGLPEIMAEMGEKLGNELREGAVVVSNAYRIPERDTLRLVREVPVETAGWDPDGSSSLWLYRVMAAPERAES